MSLLYICLVPIPKILGGQNIYRLGQNNLYICSLEARVNALNKEQVYGLVRPNLGGVIVLKNLRI